ncbi:MAG: hypothetical protein WDW38_010580 [Sanguina aurantia]
MRRRSNSSLSCAASPANVQILPGLLMTVLGFAGVFTVFSYIQAILTSVSGFPERAVSPILLVFGGGLVIGNLLGGRLADRRLTPTLIGSLAVLALGLGAMTFALHGKPAMILLTGPLGVAAFATVAPLQLRVLQKAAGGGLSLASRFNIAAFNLGNAIGACLGGVVIVHGPGMTAVTWVAALVTESGLLVARVSVRLDDRPAHGTATMACPAPLARLEATGLAAPGRATRAEGTRRSFALASA